MLGGNLSLQKISFFLIKKEPIERAIVPSQSRAAFAISGLFQVHLACPRPQRIPGLMPALLIPVDRARIAASGCPQSMLSSFLWPEVALCLFVAGQPFRIERLTFVRIAFEVASERWPPRASGNTAR
jgi:hypothetical protein